MTQTVNIEGTVEPQDHSAGQEFYFGQRITLYVRRSRHRELEIRRGFITKPSCTKNVRGEIREAVEMMVTSSSYASSVTERPMAWFRESYRARICYGNIEHRTTD
jgi:hypothetical protein